MEARTQILQRGYLLGERADLSTLREFFGVPTVAETQPVVARLCADKFLVRRTDGAFHLHPQLLETLTMGFGP